MKDKAKRNNKGVKKNGRGRRGLSIGVGVFLVVVGIFLVWYTNHMHYDIEAHEYYDVETLKSGKRIYLERPANLHNGFDFAADICDFLRIAIFTIRV